MCPHKLTAKKCCTKNRDEISHISLMHILNHVLTSRARVQRNNRRIKELAEEDASLLREGAGGVEDVNRWRDQGYTRPKVLVLLPTRTTCYEYVKKMIRMLGSNTFVDNMKRFDREYGPIVSDRLEKDEDDMGNVNDRMRRRLAVLRQKGSEWNELFGDDANADDDFVLCLSLTPNFVLSPPPPVLVRGRAGALAAGAPSSGVNVKLCADLYQCDIILASPLGLKMVISSNDKDDVPSNKADVDFLSSIDVCLIARSDVLLMQNWDHVNIILASMNRQPKKVSGIDFSRVRNFHLEGNGAHWRQLIFVSQFTNPHILSTFRRHAKNIEGSLRMRQTFRSGNASICDVVFSVRQIFQRVNCLSPSSAGLDRLRYFSEHILPKLMRSKQKHTLIYIPSYFDFIALRNLLLKFEADFVSITEYARVSEVSRGRARFMQGQKSMLLYTGRAHFFLRHDIKGTRHVIFFGLPDYAEFYPAIVNTLNCNGINTVPCMPVSCLSLFTKYDAHQLEQIVGTSHAQRMINQGEKSSFMFSPS